MTLDPLGNEVWMPDETKFVEKFVGSYVRVLVALPEYILLSKALKAPVKNKKLIRDYLALGPSQIFLDLANKYEIDLEQFLD